MLNDFIAETTISFLDEAIEAFDNDISVKKFNTEKFKIFSLTGKKRCIIGKRKIYNSM